MAELFPAELEERIVALESEREVGDDFDARSWFWLILLGVITPVALLVMSWWVR
jgi:hypothetical protein